MNTFSNKTYSVLSGHKLYNRVTPRSYGLNRLDDTMTDLRNIHWATLRSAPHI